ncbi:MAG: protein-L-isoaspartate(D-aspartate) O-methyltransferase [Verrucomicrobiota bacterium]
MLLNEIRDKRVRTAFEKVDRAHFVPKSLQAEAWSDRPLPIEDEATISQPSLVAKMTEWLDIGPEHRVLEIGTGSGYQTAILAELAAEVHTVEFSSTLSRTAKTRLEDLGYDNVHFRCGDGAEGWPEHAPYDRILATVAFPTKPNALLGQLADTGGRCLVPVGPPDDTQYLVRYTRQADAVDEETLLPVRFLSLR